MGDHLNLEHEISSIVVPTAYGTVIESARKTGRWNWYVYGSERGEAKTGRRDLLPSDIALEMEWRRQRWPREDGSYACSWLGTRSNIHVQEFPFMSLQIRSQIRIKIWMKPLRSEIDDDSSSQQLRFCLGYRDKTFVTLFCFPVNTTEDP